MTALWARRDAQTTLHDWLVGVRDEVLDPLFAASRTLRDDIEVLTAFVQRTSAEGDCRDMVLGQFAGFGTGSDTVNLSTLHSAKGREFAVVFMFGMDDGRLPRNRSAQRQLAEARRLFYVGFTRAKLEVHLLYTADRSSPFVDEVQERLDQAEDA